MFVREELRDRYMCTPTWEWLGDTGLDETVRLKQRLYFMTSSE